jgi:hypothetical protein
MPAPRPPLRRGDRTGFRGPTLWELQPVDGTRTPWTSTRGTGGNSTGSSDPVRPSAGPAGAPRLERAAASRSA